MRNRVRSEVVASVAACVAMVIVASGCGGDGGGDGGGGTPLPQEIADKLASPPTTATTYVGKVEGSDAFVAVSDREGEVTAYLCDSAALAVWLHGTADGGGVDASNGAVTLAASLTGDRLAGSVVLPDATTHAFVAAKPGDATSGLFQARSLTEDGDIIRAGWIVLDNGEQHGNAKQGVIVRPVTVLAGQDTVGVGGTSGAAVSPPPPDAQKKSFCTLMKGIFNDLLDIYEGHKASGNTQGAADAIQGCNDVLDAARDSGCGWAAT